jgi:nicotinamidase-related amidase
MKNNPALILIDIQDGFKDLSYWGNRNNPDAEKNASLLLQEWRKRGLPVYHVKHNSTNPKSKLAPGQPGNAIQDVVKPLSSEAVIQKNVNSAFIATDLKEQLEREHISNLVIAGLTTDHCVSTTVRMAGNLGFTTYVSNDATATFDKISENGERFDASLIHKTALASLHEEFATVLSTRQILETLLK